MKKGNHSHIYNFDKHKYKFVYHCEELNNSNKATNILKVKYINKTGHFCKKCTTGLLQLELAEEIPKGLLQ